MSFSHPDRDADPAVLFAILEGRSWKASKVRNPVLRKHYRSLGRTFRPDSRSCEALRDACLRLLPVVLSHSDILTCPGAARRVDLVPILIRVAKYEDHWLRRPEEWVLDGAMPVARQLGSLLRHLFARYPVPEFFDSAWAVRGTLRHEQRDWYCHIGAGGSWRDAPGMPERVSSITVHHALRAPSEMSVGQALIWGRLVSLGADEGLLSEVLRSQMGVDLRHWSVWCRLLEKVVGDRGFDCGDFGVVFGALSELLDHGHFRRVNLLLSQPMGELVGYCNHRWKVLLDEFRAIAPEFVGSDIRDLRLRVRLRRWAESSWEPMNGLLAFEECRRDRCGREVRWKIRELCSHAELMREGQALHHCVARYWSGCRDGGRAIFSLVECTGALEESRVTIEVCRRERIVVQARGAFNRLPSGVEFEMIRSWCDRNGIGLGC